VLGIERRRDEERHQAEDRAQAEKVAGRAILVAEGSQVWGVSIRNGSELPIYKVSITYEPIAGGDISEEFNENVVPPGRWYRRGDVQYPSDLVYPSASVYPSGDDTMRRAERDLPARDFAVSLRFTDAANRVWTRDREGVLTRVQGGA